MKNRSEDITLLLDDVNSNIVMIDYEVYKAVNDIAVQSVLKPKVKSCLEHLRSCLDYFAMDIYEVINNHNPKQKVYFPYGERIEAFKQNLNHNGLGKLAKKNKELYDVIESVQPFRSEDDWLLILCKLTNENKHTQLTQQERVDGIALSQNGNLLIVVDDASTVMFENLSINEEPIGFLHIEGGQLHSSKDLSDKSIGVIDWTVFGFPAFGVSVNGLLKKALFYITDMHQKIYTILNTL